LILQFDEEKKNISLIGSAGRSMMIR